MGNKNMGKQKKANPRWIMKKEFLFFLFIFYSKKKRREKKTK